MESEFQSHELKFAIHKDKFLFLIEATGCGIWEQDKNDQCACETGFERFRTRERLELWSKTEHERKAE